MDENTRTNIIAALQSARADFIEGLSKIDRALATIQGQELTADTFSAQLQGLLEDAVNYDADLDEDGLDDAEVEIPSVTYDVDAEGNVVESEGADELFAQTAEALAEIHDIEAEEDTEGYFGEYNGEDRIELTFSKVDVDGEPNGSLTVDEVRSILTDPFTQTSLANFGNLTLANVRAGDSEASKVAVLRIVTEGRAPIEALARQMMAYRGTHPFPGIGIISVVGRAVFA